MIRMGWFARAVPEKIAAYVAFHKEPWPEICDLLRRARITEYSIFLDSNESLLFAAFKYEGEDFEGDMQRLDAIPTAKAWQSLVGSCLVAPLGADDAWIRMNEVFWLE